MFSSIEKLSTWLIALSLFLLRHLIKCLVDSKKVEDATSFAKVTEEFIKSHTPKLYPGLFTLLVNTACCFHGSFWLLIHSVITKYILNIYFLGGYFLSRY